MGKWGLGYQAIRTTARRESAKIAGGNAGKVCYLDEVPQMTRCLASDYAADGIRVNRVAFKALEF